MILNLRGTNGSGKSTIVTELMRAFPTRVVRKAAGRPLVYEVSLAEPLYVLGRYETACGGCDTVKTVAEVIALVERCRKLGDVLFEGILISTTYGALGAASEKWPEFYYAFLSTPLERCVQRVKDRRAKAGNTKPFNEDGLRSKFRVINKLRFDPRIAPRAVDVGSSLDVIALLEARDPVLL